MHGEGSGPISIDDVMCNGSESSLLDCSHTVNDRNCSYNEGASVTCRTGKSRIEWLKNLS